jgi:hypothetical protein
VEQAESFLGTHGDSRERFERVCDLAQGFESAYGMELLATVHWVATQEGAASADETIRLTLAWNRRKSMFPPEHIEAARAVLMRKGWT